MLFPIPVNPITPVYFSAVRIIPVKLKLFWCNTSSVCYMSMTLPNNNKGSHNAWSVRDFTWCHVTRSCVSRDIPCPAYWLKMFHFLQSAGPFWMGVWLRGACDCALGMDTQITNCLETLMFKFYRPISLTLSCSQVPCCTRIKFIALNFWKPLFLPHFR